MVLRYLLIIILVLAVWLAAIFIIQKILNKPSSGLRTEKLFINGTEIEAEIADNFFLRMKGLSGRKSLEEGRGMLFIFNDSAVRSFWMKDMNFPIDIIWINGDKVVGFAENAPVPDKNGIPSFKSPEPVDKALELPAGSVQGIGIKAGDEIK
jgi:hypothetical protein